LLLAQTIWSIRVPCPGGSGAETVVCVSLSSDFLGGLAAGGFAVGGVTGAAVEMLEILIENDPQVSSDTL
jgi:hypothetical protein